jgi:hypothetical protein
MIEIMSQPFAQGSAERESERVPTLWETAFAMPATPVKKRKICTPAAPHKKPVCSRNLDKKEKAKWAASNMSLKAKLAASNDAWMTEVTEAIMREDLSTFTLLAKALQKELDNTK